MILPSAIASILLQSFIYALYMVVFATNGYLRFCHVRHRGASGYTPVGFPIVMTCLVLFCLITSHWIINITATFKALSIKTDRLHDVEIMLPVVPRHGPQSEVKLALYIAETLMCDGFFIYRLFVVWGERYRFVIFPVITTLLFATSGILANLSLTNTLSFPVDTIILVMYGLTVITNITITSMIILRVWRINRSLQLLGGRSILLPVVSTILESAGVYTLFVVIALLSGVLSPISFEPFLAALGPVMGLTFCLAVLLVTLGRSSDEGQDLDIGSGITFRSANVNSNHLATSVTVSAASEAELSGNGLSKESGNVVEAVKEPTISEC